MNQISVIVPVYQAKTYLDECVSSILAQTGVKVEIILVDDGSTDGSEKMCDQYAERYRSVRVIHQKNSGVSVARNAGIEIATGEFIAFCDSDDRMRPEMLLTMVTKMQDNGADVALCGYKTFPKGNSILPQIPDGVNMKLGDKIGEYQGIHTGNELCFSWRFVFRKCFLDKNNIRFDEKIHVGEDTIFNTYAVMCGNTIVIHQALYEYRIDNPHSIMRAPYKESLENDLLKQYQRRMDIYLQFGLDKHKNWMEDLGYYYATRIFNMLVNNAQAGPAANKKEAIRRILNYHMIHDSYKLCWKLLMRENPKTRLFYIGCRYKLYPIVQWMIYKNGR